MGLTLISFLYAKSNNENEYIYTEGYGKVEIKPNFIIMKVGVSTINIDADSALVNTNKTIDTLLTILNNYGINENDIETYSAAFVREYRDDRDTSTYLGIKSECVLKVTYYDVTKFEVLLNEMISNGMNILESYDFKHTSEDSLKRCSAQIAFVEATKIAEAIAEKSQRKLGSLLNASFEKPDDYRVRPDFKIELHKKRRGLSYGYAAGGGGMNRNDKLRQDLKYLRIIIPTIEFENNVYTKYELKN